MIGTPGPTRLQTTFNSLFEMHGILIKYDSADVELLPFNSLFEMLLEGRPATRRNVGRLSILYLRCRASRSRTC